MASGSIVLAASGLSAAEAGAAATGGKIRAAIIGHTGRGDYGHGLDLIFNGLENITVAGIADPVAAGREKAAERSKAIHQYDDFRVLLEKEKPRLVSIASRWTEHRLPMAMASLEAGAHLFVEKPFATTLEDADKIIALARTKNLKIAVAHQMRLAPSIVGLKEAMGEGLIGELVQMRAYGKQDARAGGEDMLVLGTHLFDLLRFFAGDPEWCTARVLQDNKNITANDGREVTEKIGLVAGNDVEAQFAFPGGVLGSFTSKARLREPTGHWGIELIGSKKSARILADVYPAIHLRDTGKWEATGQGQTWRRWEKDPSKDLNAEARGFGPANRKVVDDWMKAIEENREPICSDRAGMKAVEMVMAVYQAALSEKRIPFPLKIREHPLSRPA